MTATTTITGRMACVRYAALIGSSLLTLGVAEPAAAQTEASEAGAQTPAVAPDIVVTGSRIRNRDAASVGPILTLSAADIARSGSVGVGDLLQKLPSAGVSLNSNGTQGTSFGVSSVNLRYLGGAEGSGNRVLVLVDGHRWVDAGGALGFRDFVDLNTIPMGMVDGIEVLKDGASAIYGADAIAGVVNIRTIQPFDGIRTSGRTGITSHGDGAEYSGKLNVGKRWNGGSVIVSGSYYRAQPIGTADRSRTALSLVPVTTPGTSPNGLFILPGLANNGYFGTSPRFGSAAAPIAFNGGNYGGGAAADDSFHTAALPGDFYNTQAQGIDTTGPSKRWGVYARVAQDISASVQVYVEALYNRRQSNQRYSPVLLDIGGTTGNVRGFDLSAGQAHNPFGTANGVPATSALAFGPNAAWRIRKVMTEVGNRTNVQDAKTVRFAAGLNGHYSLFGRDWTWDAYGSYSKNTTDTGSLNGVDYDSLFLALGDPAVCAAVAGCVPVNLFSPMTPAQARYIRANSTESNYTRLYDATVNTTGTLADLPAGPLSLAIGYEYRRNSGVDSPDAYVNAPPTYLDAAYTKTTILTRAPTRGSYDLHEVYAEVAAPVFKDRAFARSLDVSLAARFSRYSTVRSRATLKAGIGYRPFGGLLLRGTYSQGFRAPSLLELYRGATHTNFQGIDPCNGGASAHRNLPGCAGVATGYNQSGYNLNGLIAGVISGSASLKPETSDTYSAGLAMTPSQLPGLSLTVDYFRIRVNDAISSPSATQIMQLCANEGGAFCLPITRDPGTGAILMLMQQAQNFNSLSTDGVDTTLRYDLHTGFGAISAVVDTSYLRSFKTVSPNPTGGAAIVDERAGKGDQPRSTYPRWKGQASLSWSAGVLDTVARGRYIGPTTDVANPVKSAHTDAIVYTDLEAGFAIADKAYRLGLGVSNLFDLQPPASYANAPINYDIYTYDARGRFLYVSVSAKM